MTASPAAGAWIACTQFDQPVLVLAVAETLTGAELTVRTVRGHQAAVPLAGLDWQPATEPVTPAGRPAPARAAQEALFYGMGVSSGGQADLFDVDD